VARERSDGGRVQRELRGRGGHAALVGITAQARDAGRACAAPAGGAAGPTRVGRAARGSTVVVELLERGIRMTVAAGAQRETLQVVLAALGIGGAP